MDSRGFGKVVLICHDDEYLNRESLARWLASFLELSAVVVISEPPGRLWKRFRREIRRVGLLRFLDVLGFRLYYRLFLAPRDKQRLDHLAKHLNDQFPEVPTSTRVLQVASPNSAETEELLRELQPDLLIARCKSILNKRIFGIPRAGTFVLHPGICPQYRNAHGCFWALVNRDLSNVGLTLLKVDEGVDTGPVHGYFRYAFDELSQTHVEIQARVVFENLQALRLKFEDILRGESTPIDTSGLPSRTWGQPWLTAYWRWRRQASKQEEKH